jgi:hypothetical protein
MLHGIMRFKCMLPGFSSRTHRVRQCPITGKEKGKRRSESKKFLEFAGDTSGHSQGVRRTQSGSKTRPWRRP